MAKALSVPQRLSIKRQKKRSNLIRPLFQQQQTISVIFMR